MNLAEQQIMINAKLSNQMITRNQNTRKVAIVVCTTTRRRTTRNVYHCYFYNYYVFFFLSMSFDLFFDWAIYRFWQILWLQWTWLNMDPSRSFNRITFLTSWFGLSWCGLTQIRPYIKLMFWPYHIFMRPTANPALYQMEKNN